MHDALIHRHRPLLVVFILLSPILLVPSYLCFGKPPRQVSQSDRGPQALAYALAEHRIVTSPEEIEQLAGTDAEGTTMLDLKRVAEMFSMRTTGMRLSQEELESYVERGHEVLTFVNHDHYVWVKRMHPMEVVVKDRSPGFQFIPSEQWYRMWFESKHGNTPTPDQGRGLCLVLLPPTR